MPVKRPLAVFVRAGHTREAYTAGEAVALRASGWAEAPAAPQGDPEPQTGAQAPIEDGSPTIANPSGDTPQPAKQKDETK